jgi:hypothetical protein
MPKYLAAAVLAAVTSVLLLPAHADAAPTRYANCTAMHKDYKGGVARPGAQDKRASGHAKYAPYVNASLYNANARLDRDRDGIACEQ